METKSNPEHAVHMFAENKPVKRHNETQLNNLDSQLVRIEAIDELPKNINVSDSQIDTVMLKYSQHPHQCFLLLSYLLP